MSSTVSSAEVGRPEQKNTSTPRACCRPRSGTESRTPSGPVSRVVPGSPVLRAVAALCASRPSTSSRPTWTICCLVGAPAPLLRPSASVSRQYDCTRHGFQSIPEELQHTLDNQRLGSAHSAPGARPVPGIPWGCRLHRRQPAYASSYPPNGVLPCDLSCRSHTRSRRAGQVADAVLSSLHFVRSVRASYPPMTPQEPEIVCTSGVCPMRKYEAVFFDAANTLLYPYPSVGEVYAQVAGRYGVADHGRGGPARLSAGLGDSGDAGQQRSGTLRGGGTGRTPFLAHAGPCDL